MDSDPGAARGRARAGRRGLRALAALVLAPWLVAATVHHSDEEALALAFPDASRIEHRTMVLDDGLRARVAERLGRPTRDHLVVLHEAWKDDALIGRAVVLDEIGKTLPFRFLVSVRPDGSVDQVLLLTYRESRGGEIERASFRAQYEGKKLGDPIRRGDDIRNVSGATLSVDSLSRGVRRALVLVDVLGSTSVAARPAGVGSGGGGGH